MSSPRNGFTRKSTCIKACIALYDDSVYRNSLAGINYYNRADFNIIGILLSYSAILMEYICDLRTDIHKICYILTALSNSDTLEQLSYLIKEHNRNALTVFTCGNGSHGCYGHKKTLIENLTIPDILKSSQQNIIAYYKVRNQKGRKFYPPWHLYKMESNG